MVTEATEATTFGRPQQSRGSNGPKTQAASSEGQTAAATATKPLMMQSR